MPKRTRADLKTAGLDNDETNTTKQKSSLQKESGEKHVHFKEDPVEQVITIDKSKDEPFAESRERNIQMKLNNQIVQQNYAHYAPKMGIDIRNGNKISKEKLSAALLSGQTERLDKHIDKFIDKLREQRLAALEQQQGK